MLRNINNLVVAISIVLIVILATPIQNGDAQESEPVWQPVTRLGGDQIPAMWPTVIVDNYKSVHVFWTELLDSQESSDYVIMHTMKTGQGEWTTPIDIIIRDSWPYSHPHGVILDGKIYLIWSEWSGLYFSSAPLIGSDSAANWQKKQVIAQQTGINQNAIVVDQTGTIHVIYSELAANLSGDGNIYYLTTIDGGDYWTSPLQISKVVDPKNMVCNNPDLAVDNQGGLYAAWGESRYINDGINTSWRERGVLFTRSIDMGENWEVPIDISDPNPTSTLWEAAPSIGVDTEGQVSLVWTCGENPFRCYRYSSDHGATWNPIENILNPFMSLAGWDGMVVTLNGDLHLITQLRYPENMYYSVKPRNGSWIGPTPISDNQEIAYGHYPEVTSDEERLYVVFQQSDKAGQVWYAEGWLTNSISFPLIPKATPTFSPTVSISTPRPQTSEIVNTPSPTVTISVIGNSSSTLWPLILAAIVPGIMVVTILLLKKFRNV